MRNRFTRREFGGLMSKPWRMVALGLGAWITYGLMRSRDGDIVIAGLTALEWSCLAVIVGCVQTIAQRLARILRTLKRKSA